jgi:hypothetical protein
MTIRLTKPWIDLSRLDAGAIPAQLGVYQLADTARQVVYIGYGGGREPFGLRSAIETAIAARSAAATARYVRYEITHGYLSRWEELLMVHRHDHGQLPAGNIEAGHRAGRLTPAGPGREGE